MVLPLSNHLAASIPNTSFTLTDEVNTSRIDMRRTWAPLWIRKTVGNLALPLHITAPHGLQIELSIGRAMGAIRRDLFVTGGIGSPGKVADAQKAIEATIG